MSLTSSEERGFIDQQLRGGPGPCVPLTQTWLGLPGIRGAARLPLGKPMGCVMVRQGSEEPGEHTLHDPGFGGYFRTLGRGRGWPLGLFVRAAATDACDDPSRSRRKEK